MQKFDKLKEQVKEVIAYSQNLDIEKLNIDKIMEDWKENKKRFYSFFPNEELIYQSKTPITVSVSENDKEAELENLKDSIYWYFNLKDLGDFISAVKDDFYSNILTSDYRYNNIIIPKGMKIIKAFKYFSSLYFL